MVNRRAFTLIEILIVLTIMLLLAALVVTAYGALSRGARIGRTRTILTTVMAALESTGAAAGGGAAPVEHPLAGSAAPRSAFVRSAAAGSSALDAAGEALQVRTLAWVSSADQPRVLLDTDVLADPTIPGLYGVPRGHLRVLGVGPRWVTSYRRLPDPTPAPTLAGPYDSTRYPDADFLVRPDLLTWNERGVSTVIADAARVEADEAASAAVERALGSHRDTLAGLQALQRSDPGWPLLRHDRVRHETTAKPPTRDRLGAVGWLDDGGVRKRYRMRGTAVYDVWGGEILLRIAGNGAYVVESAGPDGAFRWAAGPDGTLETAATAAAPAATDRDGALDNLRVGQD